jgi:hypothetical protein
MPHAARAALTFAAALLGYGLMLSQVSHVRSSVKSTTVVAPSRTTTLSRSWRSNPATLTLSRWMPTGTWVSGYMPPTRTLAIGARNDQ